MRRFDAKVALVTGGASGIGLATGQRLAAEGAIVVLVDRDAEALERAAHELAASSPGLSAAQMIALAADVTDADSVAGAFEAAAARAGRIDVLVNSAGIIARGTLGQTSVAEWSRVIDTDLASMFHAARAVVPIMRRGAGGSIVNVASIAGSRGAVNVAYAAAKGGVIALTRQLADELAADAIRVNTVSPGFTATALNSALRAAGAERGWAGRIPLARYGTPAEIAAACAFLASDDAAYVTGHDLVVDGGLTAVLRPEPLGALAARAAS